MSDVFNNYARYYNLLYRDKDYDGETEYVHSLVKRFARNPVKTVLDIGCGTGMHAYYLNRLGYQITGIDSSPEMINHALAKGIPRSEFLVDDAVSFDLGNKFDLITSLFHVFSYQTASEKALKMIKNASAHLNEHGLFIFDFWYGPAVLSERPSVKVRRLEDDEVKITRLAEPVLKVNENIVEVHFEMIIHDKQSNQASIVREIHPMRYFFKPEIELYLEMAGLQLIYYNEWMTNRMPSEHTWGICCVASKNKIKGK